MSNFKIGFLHTSPVHVPTFDGLLHELGEEITAVHVVDEKLLDDARRFGITQKLSTEVDSYLDELGRGHEPSLIICTCSTIGDLAEGSPSAKLWPIVRVDRPMMEKAISTGSHIMVAAALESTLAPTERLLRSVAAETSQSVDISFIECFDAWRYFEDGDIESYHRAIAQEIVSQYKGMRERCNRDGAEPPSCIVIAQASMAGAAAYCDSLEVPILSSPATAVAAALQRIME